MDWSFVFIKDLDFEPASLQEVSRVSFVRFDDIFYSAESDCSRKFFKCWGLGCELLRDSSSYIQTAYTFCDWFSGIEVDRIDAPPTIFNLSIELLSIDHCFVNNSPKFISYVDIKVLNIIYKEVILQINWSSPN